MANFPTLLDNLTTSALGSEVLNNLGGGIGLAPLINNANSSINALETKIGINGSAVATTLDYLLKNTASIDPGHKHTISSLTGITFPAGVIVGTTDIQTLTNKSIDASEINTGNFPATRVTTIQDRTTATVAVGNTVTETSIYSYSVPGNLLGTNKVLRLTISGTYLQNSGGAANLTINVKYGATTMCSSLTQISAGGTDPYCYIINVLLVAAGVTNSQKAVFTLDGKGAAANVNALGMAGYGIAAIDDTTAQTFTVTITHGVANVSLIFTKEIGVLELLS